MLFRGHESQTTSWSFEHQTRQEKNPLKTLLNIQNWRARNVLWHLFFFFFLKYQNRKKIKEKRRRKISQQIIYWQRIWGWRPEQRHKAGVQHWPLGFCQAQIKSERKPHFLDHPPTVRPSQKRSTWTLSAWGTSAQSRFLTYKVCKMQKL